MRSDKVTRPIGIIFISILEIIFGFLGLISGIIMLLTSTIYAEFFLAVIFSTQMDTSILVLIKMVSIIFIVFGFISILLGYLLWHGNNVVRLIHIIIYAVGVIGGSLFIFTMPIFSLFDVAIGLYIIYYLTRQRTKDFFSSMN